MSTELVLKSELPLKPISNNEILEFLLSTTNHTVLILSTMDKRFTSQRVENALRRRNIHHAHFPSPDFALDTTIDSGNVNVVTVDDDLSSLLKQTEAIRVKTVMITKTESRENIEGLIKKTWRSLDTVLISNDDVPWQDMGEGAKLQIMEKLVSFQGAEVKLSDLLDGNTSTSQFESLLDRHESKEFFSKLISNETPILLESKSLKLPKYLIERKFNSLKRVLAPDIFTHGSDDVFVVTGTDVSHLAILFKSRKMITVDNFKNQAAQENITAKVIVANGRDDFKHICEKTSVHVHLLHCIIICKEDETTTTTFEWVSTRGSNRIITHHLDTRNLNPITEQELLKLDSSVSISTPTRGTGFSTLTRSIWRHLKEQYPTRCVFQFGISDLMDMMPEFMDALEDKLEDDYDSESDDDAEDDIDADHGYGLEEFLSCHSQIEFGDEHAEVAKFVLKTMMMMKSGGGPKCELILNDWESLASTQIPVAMELLSHISKRWKGTRVWVFSVKSLQPLSFYRTLEESLGFGSMLSYELCPLSYSDQMELVRMQDKQILTNVISAAIESLSSLLGDVDGKTFTSFPRHLVKLAEICEELIDGEESNFEDETLIAKLIPSPIVIFTELCSRIVGEKRREARLLDLLKTIMGERDSASEEFDNVHEHFSVIKLLPNMRMIANITFPEVGRISLETIMQYGIISCFSYTRGGNKQANFIHPAFAEYFTWRFIHRNKLCLSASESVDFFHTTDILEGLSSLGKFMFLGEVTKTVQEKGLKLLSECLKLYPDYEHVHMLENYLSNERASLNAFKMIYNMIEGSLRHGRICELAGGLLSPKPDVFILIGIQRGHSEIVKYLVMEEGYGPEWWKKCPGRIGKFILAAVNCMEEGMSDEVVVGRQEILKLLLFVNKSLVSREIESVLSLSEDWDQVLSNELYQINLKMLHFCIEQVGGDLRRVDGNGQNVLHGLAKDAEGGGNNAQDLEWFVAKMIEENGVDWKTKDGEGLDVVDLAIQNQNVRFAVNLADNLARMKEGQVELLEEAKTIYERCLACEARDNEEEVRSKLETVVAKLDEIRNPKIVKESEVIPLPFEKEELPKSRKQIEEPKEVVGKKKKKSKWYRPFC
ncbi:unnamed protein product [Orchesella dallaii]|uniref:NB-ARC domain-containing protein n=1 Tax=Orchesella dallaii TaxID=48710 RepID=A0ABP1RAH7_9HEXA